MLNLWHRPERTKDKNILVLIGYGLSFRIERGQLVIVDGFAHEGKRRTTIILRATNPYESILILGFTGSLSLEAVRWMKERNLPCAMIGADGEIIAHFIESSSNVFLRRKQALGVTNRLDLAITQLILERKLKGQEEVLAKFPEPPKTKGGEDAQKVLRRQLGSLKETKTVNEARLLEAQAAFTYWRCWEGLPINWPEWAKKRIPQHWLYVGNRISPFTYTPRKAANPTNALLNLSYAFLEVDARVACKKAGLDPDFGFLHLDKIDRSSFIYDLMEPVRPQVDSFILDLVMSGKFQPGDFHETREGVCRVDPDLAVKLAERLNVKPLLEEIAGELASMIDKWKEKPATLSISLKEAKTEPTIQGKGLCRGCGIVIPAKKTFCTLMCYKRWWGREKAGEASKLGNERLAELRAAGMDPSHGGQAAEKRAAKAAESNRRRAGAAQLLANCRQCEQAIHKSKKFCSLECYRIWWSKEVAGKASQKGNEKLSQLRRNEMIQEKLPILS